MAVKLNPSIHDRNARSNLADDIERYWVGRLSSNVGVQYLKLVDGHVFRNGYFERTDIFCFQDFERGVNVFVGVEGDISIQPWSDAAPITPAEERSIRRQVAAQLEVEKDYVAFEARYLRERPWEDVDGMTPEAAVAHLRAWADAVKADSTPVATITITRADGTVAGTLPVYATELNAEPAYAHIGRQVSRVLTGQDAPTVDVVVR